MDGSNDDLPSIVVPPAMLHRRAPAHAAALDSAVPTHVGVNRRMGHIQANTAPRWRNYKCGGSVSVAAS